jgi:hypothetical protein
MGNRSHSLHLPLLRTDSVVEAPPRDEAPAARSDVDEATRMEEALESDAEGFFRGFRLALALALTFWAMVAALLVWLL